MGAKRRSKGKGAPAKLDSDDEDAFRNEPVPDSQNDDFYYDDIDQFHTERDKLLLERSARIEEDEDSSDADEVLAIGDDDSDMDDEEILEYKQRLRMMRAEAFKDKHGSDLEDEEDGLPNDKAWGKTKRKYYGADISDEDMEDSESENETAALEEQEARNIQKRLASQLQDKDLGLDLFQPVQKSKIEEAKSEKKITKDLSKMSRKEKLKLLKKESPELLDLIEEYKSKMTTVKERLLPLHNLIKNKTLPQSSGADFIEAQLRLFLNYCMNISYYMTLKSQHKPVQDHPVIQRIVQFRQLINQLKTAEEKMKPLIDDLLAKVNAGSIIKVKDTAEKKQSLISKIREQKARDERKKNKISAKIKKAVDSAEEESEEDEEVVPPTGGGGRRKRKELEEEGEETEESEKKKKKPADSEDELGMLVDADAAEEEEEYYEEDDEKRAITYEMAKNKGLTAKKKKTDRNPRVKNRMKYRKAKIRRKGQIREVRHETSKYAGEVFGIRAGIKRGIKLK